MGQTEQQKSVLSNKLMVRQ